MKLTVQQQSQFNNPQMFHRQSQYIVHMCFPVHQKCLSGAADPSGWFRGQPSGL